MEGYLIRVPMEACYPGPVWDQTSDTKPPVHSRVLYYVLEEGYLRGYEEPNDVKEPVESFRLTSNRIEVNTMCSVNIFEIKARAVKLRLPQRFVEGTLRSDSRRDDGDIKHADLAALCMPQPTIPPSPNVQNKNYHVVFLAANTDLVTTWSVKLLNWNRSVFGSPAGHDEAALRLANTEILHALDVVNAANQFVRPVEISTTLQADREPAHPRASTSEQESINLASIILPTLANDSRKLTLSKTTNVTPAMGLADIAKPSDLSAHPQPPNSWWIASFGRYRKISSYSQRR